MTTTEVDADARRADPRQRAGRRPAAGPLRLGPAPAAGWRRDRPPPARPAPGRLPGARRAGRAGSRHPPHRARRRPRGVRLLHGRAVRDGHGERAHGRGADRRHDDHPQRGLRAARPVPGAHADPHGSGDRGHRLQRHDRPRARQAGRLRAPRLAGPHRDRLLHGAGRRDGRRAADQGLRARGPAHDPAGLRPPRAALRARRRRRAGAGRPEARRRARRRRLPDQGGGRPVAGVPGRPDVDRRRPRHAVRGLRADLREDVREPAVLRRQADPHGRGDHDLRPAPGDRDRPPAAARRAARVARHPRRHGDADRRAVRAGEVGDRQRAPDRPRLRAHRRAAAPRSVRASSAWSRSVPQGDHPPDPQRDARRPARRDGRAARGHRGRARGLGGARVRRDRTPRRSSTRRCSRAATRRPPSRPTSSSTSRATCSCCART